MKLNKAFLIHDSGERIDLIPTGDAAFSGVVRGNKTFGLILELLKTQTTEEEIVSAIKAQFNDPAGAVERDVARALSELRKIGALDE